MIAFHSTYPSSRPHRGGQITRLHILREDGKNARHEGECGTGAYATVNAEKTFIDPLPPAPPAGLAWCPKCLGRAAERVGCLDQLAALVIGGQP